MVADVSIFTGLNDRIQTDIAGEIESCHIRGGDVLFREGDDGDSLYVVVSGRLRVVQEDAGADGLARTLRHVVRGEAVGEISLFTGEPRSATVVAQRDSELGRLSREAFGRLLVREPGSVLGLTTMMARWLAKPDVRLASRTSNPTTIAILSLAREAPLVDFAANLSRSLSAFGRTLHLNAQLLESILGKAIAQATLGNLANPGFDWCAGKVSHSLPLVRSQVLYPNQLRTRWSDSIPTQGRR